MSDQTDHLERLHEPLPVAIAAAEILDEIRNSFLDVKDSSSRFDNARIVAALDAAVVALRTGDDWRSAVQSVCSL